MPTKRTEFGEVENRLGERRSHCMIDPPAPVCAERMRALREYIDTHAKGIANQLEHRTKEIDAHFVVLNNAQARLDKDRDEFLRQELYMSEHKTLKDRILYNDGRIESIQLWRATLEGKQSRSNVISYIALAITVIFGLLHFVQGVR